MALRHTLQDYIGFFGVEPEWISEHGWYHGTRFRRSKGKELLLVTIAPDELEFACEWWQSGLLRFRFETVMAVAWSLSLELEHEVLEVRYDRVRTEACRLQIEPHISIDWNMGWGCV